MAQESRRSEASDVERIHLAYAGIGHRTTDRDKAYMSRENILKKCLKPLKTLGFSRVYWYNVYVSFRGGKALGCIY